MLEGKNVNLRIFEKADLSLITEWLNNPEIFGVYNPLMQLSGAETEKRYDNLTHEEKWFIIEKKDRKKVGSIIHFSAGRSLEIGHFMIQSEGSSLLE